MLEVRQQGDGFLVFDTQASEAVMRFDHRRDADELVAEMQIQELHAQLEGWTLEGVPPVAISNKKPPSASRLA